MRTSNAAVNVVLLALTLAMVEAGRQAQLRHVPQDGVVSFADGLGAMEEEKEPEHNDAAPDEHSGKPGEGGEPMVPRTHEHGETKKKHEWSYKDPDSWAQEYKDCSGKAQSPVNLVSENVKKGGKDSLQYDYKPQEGLHIDNNGHNVQVNGKFGSLKLPDGNYNVAQFHFHFPSEHKVNGKLASGEIHIVHQKEGATGTDGLAVVGILLEESALDNSKWDRSKEIAFLSQLHFGQALPNEGASEKIKGSVDLAATFSRELKGGFYHYQGSLTTPPCSETVHWFVLEEPAAVTPDMVKHFKSLFPNPTNNRPDQMLNAREIVENKEGVKGEYKSNSRGSLCTLGSALAFLGLFLALQQ